MINVKENKLMCKQSEISPNQTVALKITWIITTKTIHEINYFIAGPGMEADTTLKIHDEFSDVFTGIGCFKGIFHYTLQMM